jgi:type IV pilus assembly protein PilM
MLASLFRKETLVGLDIGSANIKAVQIEPQRFGYRVVRAAQQATPPRSVRDGIITDKSAVAAAIQELFKAARINATGAVLAVSGPSVMVRQVQMPRMTEAALAKTIRFEVGKYITSNIEETALAYEVLGASPSDPTQDEMMLVSAPREAVDGRVALLEMLGLDAVSIDIEAFALLRGVFEIEPNSITDGLQVLVDIGASHTEVTIMNNGVFGLTRSIPLAGNAFTEAIQSQLRGDFTSAEEKKKEIDLATLINGGVTPNDAEALRSLQGSVDEVLREVRRSINYYQSQLPEGMGAINVTEIILTGGSALMEGLAPYMNARLGIETRVASPFSSSSLEAEPEAIAWLQENGPQLGIALGLALKEHFGSKKAASAPSVPKFSLKGKKAA